MKDIADKYFMEGYSCSEAVVQAAIDKGFAPKELLSAATPFSGGMGARCLCGAVAGAQLVIGCLYGKNENRDGKEARKTAKEFYDKFTNLHNVTCCKVLSKGFEDFHSPERRNHCRTMVKDSCEILSELIKEKICS